VRPHPDAGRTHLRGTNAAAERGRAVALAVEPPITVNPVVRGDGTPLAQAAGKRDRPAFRARPARNVEVPRCRSFLQDSARR